MRKEDLDFVNSAAQIKNRVAVKDYYFNELPQALRSLAFTVSNLETLRQVEIVQRSLQNAMSEGLNFNEWKNQLDTDTIRNLSRSRLETVYRTNSASVYNKSTRYNAVTSNVTPYLMFSAVGDSRTRPQHADLDGIIKRGDSPFWNKYTPPLGFNCRCRIIPISKKEAEKRGISRKSENNLPDPDNGFNVNSSMGDVNSGVNEQANKAIEKLHPTSPFRQKFINAQNNIDSLTTMWWNKVKGAFE